MWHMTVKERGSDLFFYQLIEIMDDRGRVIPLPLRFTEEQAHQEAIKQINDYNENRKRKEPEIMLTNVFFDRSEMI